MWEGVDGKVSAAIFHTEIFVQRIADQLCEKYPNVTIHIYPIVNEFFGEKITVSGLLTGQDLKKQLTGKELGKQLLLPCNILRTGYDVFLDDVTVGELEKSLQVNINMHSTYILFVYK